MSATTFTLLMYIALIPPIFLMWIIYKQDLIESEPVGLVLQSVLLGCLVPIFIFILNTPFSILCNLFGNGLLFELADNFIRIALLEEGGKMLMFYLRIWNNKEFNYRFDAIIYSVAISIGFASIENVMYVMNHGLEVAITRAISAIPAHVIFAIFMGHYLGEAKYHSVLRKKHKEKEYRIKGLLIPVFLHGLYDFICRRPEPYFTLIFWIFLITVEIMAILKVYNGSKKDTVLAEPVPIVRNTINEYEIALEETRKQAQKEYEENLKKYSFQALEEVSETIE